jgi:GT2 family glycosyltransferase
VGGDDDGKGAVGWRAVAGAPPPPRAYDADVVILALDRPEETLSAIGSALAQRGVSRHVTVLDQGSSAANVARFAALLDGRPDAWLLCSAENLGVAGGRNLASALGHARVIVGLDNDASFADADTLARAVAALDADPGLAAIGLRIVVDATGEDDLLSWGYPCRLLPRAGESFDAATFVGAGHAISRAAWEAVGGYDPRLFFCWEEYDFCLGAIARGWRIRYRGDIVVRHKISAERRVAWSGRRWFYFVRNRLYLGRKHGAAWWALAPRALGYLLRGIGHGLARQTLAGVAAASVMARGIRPTPLPQTARSYLRTVDRVQRGGLIARLRTEVLGRLPGETHANGHKKRPLA